MESTTGSGTGTDDQLAKELRAAQAAAVAAPKRRRVAVMKAKARGWSTSRIARESGADRATVRAILAAAEKPSKEQS